MQAKLKAKTIKLTKMATRLCGTSKDDNQGLVWKTKNPREYQYQPGQCILFPVVFTPPSPSHHGSVWLLPVISLLLTNTVSPRCRLAYPYDWRGFARAKKKTSV